MKYLNNSWMSLNHLSQYDRDNGWLGGLILPKTVMTIKSYAKALAKLGGSIGLFILMSECLADDVDTGDKGTEEAMAKLGKYLSKSKWYIAGFCVPVGMWRGLCKDEPKKGLAMFALGVGAPIADKAIKSAHGLLI
ncbi:MAG: hypothetical protein HRT87_06550 [Legionellales bacterium]|nr:hypothetical protein [Legionellales bacterium]